MGNTAFIFPGQGSQYAGMGRELYEKYDTVRDTLNTANNVLGYDLTGLMFEGPEDELKMTENTQPAILTLSVAICRLLEGMGIHPKACVGLSLGEYSALVASGVIKFEDALPLVRKRGKYMQEAVPEGVGAMAAVIGLDRQKVFDVIKEASRFGTVEATNFNCPGQVAISGEAYAVEKASCIAKEAGAIKSVVLKVSAPFHCSMLKSAGDRLRLELEKTSFYKGTLDCIANVDADYYSFEREEIIDKLSRQVYNPVMFEDSIRKLMDDGFDKFIEVGPGGTLSGFVKRISKKVGIYNVEDINSLNKLAGGYTGE